MKVTVIIEQNGKGCYSVYIKDDRIKFGVLGEGKAVEETIKNFHIRIRRNICQVDFV